MAATDPTFYDSVRGLAILVQLPEPLQSLWASAADQAGIEPYSTGRWEDSYVVAGGKRPTMIVAVAGFDLDPRLFDATDEVYRVAPTLIVANEQTGSAFWRHVAWDLLPPDAAKEQVVASLLRALDEAKQRRIDWDLVEDYRRREQTLSNDEHLVLEAVCAGKLNKQIASDLGVSIRTVEQRRRRVFSKMGVESAVPLADRTATVRTLERHVYRPDRAHALPAPKMMSPGVQQPTSQQHHGGGI